MTKVNDPSGSAVSQNTIPPLKQFSPQGPATAGSSSPEAPTNVGSTAEQVNISNSRRNQLESANAFIRELKQSQYTLQVGVSAVQELEEGLRQGKEQEEEDRAATLQGAGERALRLMESVGRADVDKDIDNIRKKLAKEEPVSFADVVDAVAVLARVAQSGQAAGSPEELQKLAEAVSLVNQALTQAQGRMEGLTETATKASNKYAEDTQTKEGLDQMSKALLTAMQISKQSALKAQANINPDFVSRVLQSNDFKPV